MHADHREDLKEIGAGDIAATLGLKRTFTGDTLCDQKNPIILEAIDFPEPVISLAIEPKTTQDQDKMGNALAFPGRRGSDLSSALLMSKPARRFCMEWVSCIWRSWLTACCANSR